MGEIADAMINGDGLCGGCGVSLEWADGPGFPLYCSRECALDDASWDVSKIYRNGILEENGTLHSSGEKDGNDG